MNKTALVTGGCGFVGRHMVKRLLNEGYEVWVIDNLSTGKDPESWLSEEERIHVVFIDDDVISALGKDLNLGTLSSNRQFPVFDEVFHFASVVGGRAVIEGDPMAVAIDLAVDAVFWRWVVVNKDRIGRVLYASSSAAYPVHLQTESTAVALKEEYIRFDEHLGMPDMTYGWSKLTGEYLSQVAAKHYGVHAACIRPFSGYGGDQDASYPVPAIAARVLRLEDPLIVWGTGEQGRDFVHIDDCIEGMFRALNAISDGRGVNIGTGILTTFKEVAALFADIVGYSPTIQPLIGKPQGVQSRYSDPTGMRELLHWTPGISLREGFTRVLEEQKTTVLQLTKTH